MKTLLKIAALILLGVIAIKLAFGLLALVIGLIIPLAVLGLVGLIVWKLIGGKTLWQKLTSKTQLNPTVPTPPAWQMDMDEDLNSYQTSNEYLEHKKTTSLKY